MISTSIIGENCSELRKETIVLEQEEGSGTIWRLMAFTSSQSKTGKLHISSEAATVMGRGENIVPIHEK